MPYSTNTLERTYTIETRINGKENRNIINYFLKFSNEYNSVYRHAFNMILKSKNNISNLELRKYIQSNFNYSMKLSNSIVFDVRGTYNSIVGCYKYKLYVYESKVKFLIKKLDKLRNLVNTDKEKARTNSLSEKGLRRYKRRKNKLHFLIKRIQKLNNRIFEYKEKIKNNNYSIVFGSKKLFKAQYNLKENGFKSHEDWLKEFRNKRNSHILYVGSRGELYSNNDFRLIPNNDSFIIKIRKNTKELEYVYGKCDFKYKKNDLKEFLLNKYIHGITYRLISRNNRLYLQAMITPGKLISTFTSKENGCIGLDFNQGFIELAETDKYGNLISQNHYDLLYHRKGNSNQESTELRQIISKIVKYSQQVGKSISIERLNFNEKKSKTDKAKSDFGKEYNSMIHNLNYAKYTSFLEDACFRNNIELIKVNPAYTSKIPKIKYCQRMKLTVHQGAAFEIARKGQNINYYLHDKKVLPIKKSA